MRVEKTMNTIPAMLYSTNTINTMQPLKVIEYLYKKGREVLWSGLAGTSL